MWVYLDQQIPLHKKKKKKTQQQQQQQQQQQLQQQNRDNIELSPFFTYLLLLKLVLRPLLVPCTFVHSLYGNTSSHWDS